MSSTILFSQNSRIDSLYSALKLAENDTIRLETYQNIVLHYSVSDLEKANAYADSIYVLAESMQFETALINYFVLKGILQYRNADFQGAVDTYTRGLNHPRISEYFYPRVSMLNNLASSYKALTQYDSFVKYSTQALRLNEENNNVVGLFAGYFNLAEYYTSNVDFNLAAEYIDSHMSLALKENNREQIARAHILFAKLSRMEYQFDESITSFEEALRIYKTEYPENVMMARSLTFELCRTQVRDNKLQPAKILLEKLLTDEVYVPFNKDLQTQIRTLLLICYTKLNDYDRAFENYNWLNSKAFIAAPDDSIRVKIARADFELAFDRINSNTETELIEAIELSHKYGHTGDQERALGSLARYYYERGSNKRAYELLNERKIISDSLRKLENSIINLSHKRRFEVATAEIKVLELDRELLNKNIEIEEKENNLLRAFLFIAILLVIASVILLLNLRQRSKLRSLVEQVKQLKSKIFRKEQEAENRKANLKETDFATFLIKEYELTEALYDYWDCQAFGFTENEMARAWEIKKRSVRDRRERLYSKLSTKAGRKIDDRHSSVGLYLEETIDYMNNQISGSTSEEE